MHSTHRTDAVSGDLVEEQLRATPNARAAPGTTGTPVRVYSGSGRPVRAETPIRPQTLARLRGTSSSSKPPAARPGSGSDFQPPPHNARSPDEHANPRLGLPADRHNASFPAAHLKSGPGVQPTAPTARSPGALVQNFRGVQAESMAPTSRLNDFRTLCNPTERCCRLPGHRQLQEEK